MAGLLDSFLSQMAGGPRKQPAKLNFGTASGGDGVKRPLSYTVARQIMGERPQSGSRSPSSAAPRREATLLGMPVSKLMGAAKKK